VTVWLTTRLVNAASVAICTRYELAPEIAAHESAGVVDWPVAPFAGAERLPAAVTPEVTLSVAPAVWVMAGEVDVPVTTRL